MLNDFVRWYDNIDKITLLLFWLFSSLLLQGFFSFLALWVFTIKTKPQAVTPPPHTHFHKIFAVSDNADFWSNGIFGFILIFLMSEFMFSGLNPNTPMRIDTIMSITSNILGASEIGVFLKLVNFFDLDTVVTKNSHISEKAFSCIFFNHRNILLLYHYLLFLIHREMTTKTSPSPNL